MRVGWVIGALVIVGGTVGTSSAEEPGQVEEVVVTATRASLPKSKVTKSVTVLDAAAIERQHADTALEVLRNVPGVFVRRSGAVGRTTSVVIRGSTDDQVLVLIDGVEVSSPTLGSFNWSTLPADFIERIEVLRGSASTLYGSKAIGGVINIITKRGQGPMRTSYQQEFGTLRTFKETVATQAELGPIRYNIGVARLDSRGLSTGDDVEVTHVAAAGGVELAKWLSLDVALNNNDSHVGIDDGAFRPDPNRFIEREHLVLSTTVKARPLEPWEHELRFSFNDDDTLDVDVGNPGTAQATTKSRINTTRYGMDWLSRLSLGRWGLSTTGFELKDEEAESGSFRKTIFQWAWFLQHQLDVTDRLMLIGGVRNLRHNFFGHETTSEASASYRVPGTETRLRANFSQGFRAPDLNDLFFTSTSNPNFGNPDLQPETSQTFELGVGQDWWQNRVGGELTWFHTEVDQLIKFTGSGTTLRAINLNEVEMEGFELEGHLDPGFGLRISASWTYTDAEEEPSKEEIVNIPKHVLGFNLDYDFLTRWRAHLNATLVDHREANNRQRVKGYAKLDGSLTFQATKHFQLYGRVENLTDRHYSEVLGFPAPGTLFFIGGKVDI